MNITLVDIPTEHRLLFAKKHMLSKKSKDQDEHSGNSNIDLICFALDEETYGIELKCTQEIVRAERIIRVPKSPPYFQGMINLRGNIITVIDLKKILGFMNSQITWKSRILIVEQEQHSLGLLVDRVREITRLDKKYLSAPPTGLSDVKHKFIKGVAETPKKIITLLDSEHIFRLTSQKTDQPN